MTIFEYRDYKRFLGEFWLQLPKKGRGQAQQLAQHLAVNSVVISQVVKGSRDFSSEQALQIAQFYGWEENKTEYFVCLVQQARSGTQQLKKYYEAKLQKLRDEHTTIKSRLVQSNELSDLDKAQFYSNWYYVAVSLLSSIEGFDNVESIAKYFQLSRAKVNEILAFLVKTGLCIEEKGRFKMGIASTYIGPESPFANNHRRNWRQKSIQKMTEPGPNDRFYTGTYSLSEEDLQIIRKQILALIEQTSKRVSDSPCEKLACLTIDFFEF